MYESLLRLSRMRALTSVACSCSRYSSSAVGQVGGGAVWNREDTVDFGVGWREGGWGGADGSIRVGTCTCQRSSWQEFLLPRRGSVCVRKTTKHHCAAHSVLAPESARQDSLRSVKVWGCWLSEP